jgi:hypothetical protein
MQIQVERIWLFETVLADPFFLGTKDGITPVLSDGRTIDTLTIDLALFKIEVNAKGGLVYNAEYGGEDHSLTSSNGNYTSDYSLEFNVPLDNQTIIEKLIGNEVAVLGERRDGTFFTIFGQFTAEAFDIDNLLLKRVTLTSGNTNALIFEVTTPTVSAVLHEINPGCEAAPPPAPSDLVATASAADQIDLSWTNVTGNTGYAIERSPDGVGSWVQIALVGTDIFMHNDTGLTDGTEFFYRVRTLNGVPGEYSNISSDFTKTIFDGLTEVWSSLQLYSDPENDSNQGLRAFRLRRDSDDAQTDVYWSGVPFSTITLSNEVEAGGTLGTWLGANDAFISKMYAQSNTLDYNIAEYSQNILASQPRAATVGVLETKNGVFAPSYGQDGVRSFLNRPETVNQQTGDYTATSVVSNDQLFGSAQNAGAYAESKGTIFYRNNDTSLKYGVNTFNGGAYLVDFNSIRNTTASLIQSIRLDLTNDEVSCWDNGLTGDQSFSVPSIPDGGGTGLGYQTGSIYLIGTIQTHIIMNQTEAADRVAIETKLASLFSITYPA